MFLIIVLGFIIFLFIAFEPAVDCIPLYHGEQWYILWYNRYTISHWKLCKSREWIQLFCVEK